MPQLELASYPSQIFWLAISFGLLYLLLAFIILPRFAKIQTQRQEATIGKRQQAEQAAERAEKALALYESKIAESRALAQKEAQTHKRQTDTLLNQQSEKAQAEIETKIQTAEQDIANQIAANREESHKAAALTAQAILEKIAAVKVPEHIAQQAVQRVRS